MDPAANLKEQLETIFKKLETGTTADLSLSELAIYDEYLEDEHRAIVNRINEANTLW